MKITEAGRIAPGQDGAIWGDLLFRFESDSTCHVYDLTTQGPSEIACFLPEKAALLRPHSNAVMFGCEYASPEDEFPLLYSNIYNNYAKAENRMVGVCCVYRVQREGTSFRAEPVQLISVGFVEDPQLWCSPGGDVRPYGNFTIDRERGIYYGFTMRDADNTTRYFAFPLPRLSEGNMDERFGVRNVILQPEDILFRFDCPYHRFLQGACTHKGKIYSLEGFTADGGNPPAMRIISAEDRQQLQYILLGDYGLSKEPELIDFRGDQCWYGDCAGNLYNMEF